MLFLSFVPPKVQFDSKHGFADGEAWLNSYDQPICRFLVKLRFEVRVREPLVGCRVERIGECRKIPAVHMVVFPALDEVHDGSEYELGIEAQASRGVFAERS